jgi:hypothetical protein
MLSRLDAFLVLRFTDVPKVKLNSGASVRQRTIPTERPLLVGEVVVVIVIVIGGAVLSP